MTYYLWLYLTVVSKVNWQYWAIRFKLAEYVRLPVKSDIPFMCIRVVLKMSSVKS